MATRGELRGAVRARLEDAGGSPLWDDATLNGLLADALRRYGLRRPAERAIAVAVADGARTVALTPPAPGDRVTRVLDADGAPVPRERGGLDDGRGGPVRQGWRPWNGELLLSAPASGGTWRVELLGERQTPVDDVAAVDLDPGDEEIVVLLAAAGALRRRAVEDAKRGSARSAEALLAAADGFERLAEERLAARRRAFGGWLAEG